MNEQQLRKQHIKRAMAEALITENKARWLELIGEVEVLAIQVLKDEQKAVNRG